MAEWLHDHGKDAAPYVRQALEEHAAALKLDPKNARAAYLRGLVQRTIGDHNPDEEHRRKHYEAAMKEFADAVGRNPQFVEAWLAHGEILDKFGRPADAVEHYEAALKAVPDHAELRERLDAARERLPK
jgi:tetratricopeptide (TPR) repeat protein